LKCHRSHYSGIGSFYLTGIALSLVFFLSVGGDASAQTVDIAVEVKTGPAASLTAKYKIYIDDSISASITADQKWHIVGACSNQPNVSIYIDKSIAASLTADIKVYIDSSIAASITADKKICITNADALDDDTLRLLKLID